MTTVEFLSNHYKTMVHEAMQTSKIEPEDHMALIAMPFNTLEDAGIAFGTFHGAMRDRILKRITHGAEYIEKHPNVPAAVRKYNQLCVELQALDGRRYDARQDQTD